MQIMHVIPGDMWAGAEAQLYYTVVELLNQSSHDVTVVLFNKKELYYKLSRKNIDIYYLDEEENNGLSLCIWLRELFLRKSPDIVHVHEYKSHILASIAKLLARRKCNIIRTLHGRTIVPINYKYLKTWPIIQIENVLLRYYTASIIAVSIDIRDMLTTRYKSTNICHIRNAVQIPNMQQYTVDGTRKKYNIGANTFWIATAARLVYVKNLNMLINAAAIMRDHAISDYQISIFGEGPLKQMLQNMIDKEGLSAHVKLLGHTNEILPVLKSINVFVLSSFSEGLPMSLLEAMSFGTVPVCTRVGGVIDVIDDTETGFLVESDNSVEMANILISLMNNEEIKRKVGANAAAAVMENYSIEQSVAALLHLYASEYNNKA